MRGMKGPGKPRNEKPNNIKSSMLDLLKYLKPWYKAIVVALILSLAGTALTLIAPDKMADLTNTIGDGLATGIDMDAIIKAIIIVLAIYVCASLVTCASNYVMITVMQKLAWNMRNSISEKMNRLPLKYFDKVSVGDVLSRITNDVDTISSALNSSITTLVQAVAEYLYWEFHETDMLGVRMGNWKLVVQRGNCRLYDLANDFHEDNNVAAQYPEIVQQMKDIIKREHTDSSIFRVTIPE